MLHAYSRYLLKIPYLCLELSVGGVESSSVFAPYGNMCANKSCGLPSEAKELEQLLIRYSIDWQPKCDVLFRTMTGVMSRRVQRSGIQSGIPWNNRKNVRVPV